MVSKYKNFNFFFSLLILFISTFSIIKLISFKWKLILVHPWNNGNFLFNVKSLILGKKINIDFLSGYPGLFDYLNFLYHTFFGYSYFSYYYLFLSLTLICFIFSFLIFKIYFNYISSYVFSLFVFYFSSLYYWDVGPGLLAQTLGLILIYIFLSKDTFKKVDYLFIGILCGLGILVKQSFIIFIFLSFIIINLNFKLKNKNNFIFIVSIFFLLIFLYFRFNFQKSIIFFHIYLIISFWSLWILKNNFKQLDIQTLKQNSIFFFPITIIIFLYYLYIYSFEEILTVLKLQYLKIPNLIDRDSFMLSKIIFNKIEVIKYNYFNFKFLINEYINHTDVILFYICILLLSIFIFFKRNINNEICKKLLLIISFLYLLEWPYPSGQHTAIIIFTLIIILIIKIIPSKVKINYIIISLITLFLFYNALNEKNYENKFQIKSGYFENFYVADEVNKNLIDLSEVISKKVGKDENISGFPNLAFSILASNNYIDNYYGNFIGDEKDIVKYLFHLKKNKNNWFIMNSNNWPYKKDHPYFPKKEKLMKQINKIYKYESSYKNFDFYILNQ